MNLFLLHSAVTENIPIPIKIVNNNFWDYFPTILASISIILSFITLYLNYPLFRISKLNLEKFVTPFLPSITPFATIFGKRESDNTITITVPMLLSNSGNKMGVFSSIVIEVSYLDDSNNEVDRDVFKTMKYIIYGLNPVELMNEGPHTCIPVDKDQQQSIYCIASLKTNIFQKKGWYRFYIKYRSSDNLNEEKKVPPFDLFVPQQRIDDWEEKGELHIDFSTIQNCNVNMRINSPHMN